MDPAEADALRARCTSFLHWHGQRRPADILAELPEDIAADEYGERGAVAELELEVAELLGKESVAFFPSGTMAQQAALRVHADAKGRRAVAFHPTCHVHEHEEAGHHLLHGLVSRPVGDPRRLITLSDLDGVTEPVAALLLELPQREIGGQLPAWDDLVPQVGWARDRGAAVHMDGARLWQCPPTLGKSLATISSLFDTVYVSFYKDLGALSGAALAGAGDVIAQARTWRKRHGGTLHGLWPLAASALAALRLRLPRMAAYREHALAIADAVRPLDGVQVVPDPPHTSMMDLLLHGEADQLAARMHRLARDDGVWSWRRTWPTDHPGWQRVELSVGDATLACSPAEIAHWLSLIVSGDAGSQGT